MAVNRKKLGALLVALIATIAVAGTAAASHTSTPGITKKQITIGGTFPFTGKAALYKTIPAAEQAYYAYVNAHGGVFHRKIKDITLDDAYDPSKTPGQTKKLGPRLFANRWKRQGRTPSRRSRQYSPQSKKQSSKS